VRIFQQRGSLKREEIAAQIPECIQDAMALTELLHQRYLWAYALCIVQDHVKASHNEITRMASIYANADLTIVAADWEDASYGLRGIRDVSLPSSHPRLPAKLSNGAQIVACPSPNMNEATWSKRGWTFQEYLFSQKQLTFCNDSIMWKCACNTFYEVVGLFNQNDIEHCPQTNLVSTLASVSKISVTSWPDLIGYLQLAYDFNRSGLTYLENAVDAFSDITTLLSAVFHGGFLFGSPEIFYDFTLLWKADSEMKQHFPKRQIGPKSRILSWSWMDW
jgi:hypothetical protein